MRKKRTTTRRHHRSWSLTLAGVVVISLLAMLLGRHTFLFQLELLTYDLRMLLRGPVSVEHSDIVIVGMDDEAAHTLPHSWPLPRSYYARLIRNLADAGARMIVFDIMFTEPSERGEDLALALETELRSEKLVHSGKVVYQTDVRMDRIISHLMPPIEPIRESAQSIGMVNEVLDRDGFTRQYPAALPHREVNYLSLAMKVFQRLEGIPDSTGLYRTSDEIRYGPLRIPRMDVKGVGTFLINYYGPAGTFPVYSLSYPLDDSDFELRRDDTDVMDLFLMPEAEFREMIRHLPQEAAEEFQRIRKENPFQDKIVLIGATAPELEDRKMTPFFREVLPWTGLRHDTTPGVEVHANVLQMLLDRQFLRNVPPLVDGALVLLFVLAVAILYRMFKPLTGFLITTLLMIGYLAFTVFMFTEHQFWLASLAPLAGGGAMYLFSLMEGVMRERRDKAMIHRMFTRYVPPKVVEELIANPAQLSLGGERRWMSCLFMDVISFTTIAEHMSPENLVKLLNEYLSEMSRIIQNHEGIIDKYEGDLIMAEWGAPLPMEDHAMHACRAALSMQQRLEELRLEWRKRDMPELHARIGINTGWMLVGNLGSEEAFDYTVVGDAVNLASRLEGANRTFGSRILIGPDTWEAVREQLTTRLVDCIRVHGRQKGVRIYEVVGIRGEPALLANDKLLAHYEKGIEHYFAGRFEDAVPAFRACQEIDPEDGPSLVLLDRCQHYMEHPPQERWDGVFQMTSK